MTSTLARQGNDPPILRQLARHRQPAGGTVEIQTIESLATISAGFKKTENGREIPQPARDGKIKLHDPFNDAPGLKAALEERHYDSLVIAFAWNDPAQFVRQRMSSYGDPKIVGDENGLLMWRKGTAAPVQLDPGTEGFKTAWAKCTPETWVYFHLAMFDAAGPALLFPDNTTLPYRLRFTSQNSRRALDSCLRGLRDLGQTAFMPIVISIRGQQPVLRPDGTRGTAPVWTFRPLVAPEGTTDVIVRSQRLQETRDGARQQMSALALPAPDPDLVHQAMVNEVIDVTDAQVALVARGGPCDAAFFKRLFGYTANGTPVQSDEARHKFIAWYTKRHPDQHQTDSLRDFLDHASHEDATDMMTSLMDLLDQRKAQDPSHQPSQPPAVTGAGVADASAYRTDASTRVTPADASSTGVASGLDSDAAGRGSSAASALSAPAASATAAGAAPGVEVRVVECSICGVLTPCYMDGEAYVCVDRDACTGQPQAGDTEIGEDDVASDKDALDSWLNDLRDQFPSNTTRDFATRQNAAGKVFSKWCQGDMEAARQLMIEVCGVQEPTDLTIGMTEAIFKLDEDDDWSEGVTLLRAVRGF